MEMFFDTAISVMLDAFNGMEIIGSTLRIRPVPITDEELTLKMSQVRLFFFFKLRQ